MTVLVFLDTYLYLLTVRRSFWQIRHSRPIHNSAKQIGIYQRLHLVNIFSPFQRSSPPSCKVGQRALNRHLSGHFAKVSTASSKALKAARKSMSRIKNTFDSVTKAVSSTHNEIIARIVRSKPNPSGVAAEDPCQVNEANAAQPETDKQGFTSADPNTEPRTADTTPMVVQDFPHQASKECPDLKTNLFHANYFTTNFGETYNFLASHINGYYFSDTSMEKTKAIQDENVSKDGADAASEAVADENTTGSTKKSISNFLSNQSSNVHAFVGSYLGGLVPKLRPETKALEENGKEKEGELVENKGEQETSKEIKGAEERAKRLSLQWEKIIARVSVDNRTRALVQSLHRATDRRLCISRVEELSCHLLEFPETRGVAVKERVIPCLLRLRQAQDDTLRAVAREALALVGYSDPVKGRGIRVLTIDGGGTRGVVALQTLRKLQEMTGKPVHQLFDYICGVSTGAILAFMVGLFRIPLDECEEMYRNLGKDVFKQNVIVGTVKMGWSHAFYDSEMWEKMLKERMGSDLLIESARNPLCPKVSAVSTVVNKGLPLKAFVFRNYNHFPGVKSHYMGGCQYNLWQAIRASSAAPGYFQEYVLGNDLHQDGGLLINNPCALAIHECKCLWPDVPVQCVISLGTGRFESAGKSTATHTSLKAKLTNVISSATDTEDFDSILKAFLERRCFSSLSLLLMPGMDKGLYSESAGNLTKAIEVYGVEVHKMLDALLPPDTYFRFNPLMNEDVPLDENRKEKLALLQMDGKCYLERNEEKLKKAVKILSQERTTLQQISDWVKLKKDMYDGLPFSKL